ncbi:hypothetical protein RJT34_22855 [Clitoria ternatea]|uniref:Uncharacterized protein n=1 Tax=Clitoria ternatea TaxID=43366 RepID=A0AAN9IFY7_CLITE
MITQIFKLINEADERYFHGHYPCYLPEGGQGWYIHLTLSIHVFVIIALLFLWICQSNNWCPFGSYL